MHGLGIVLEIVLVVEVIPIGILISALLDRSLQRRARFAVRLTTFTAIQAAPVVAVVAGVALRVLSEHGVGALLAVCVLSVFVMPALMPFLLFQWPGRGRQSSEDDGEDPGPGPSRHGPFPPQPIDGPPLLDADQSSVRARGSLPLGRSRRVRRTTREPERESAPVLL